MNSIKKGKRFELEIAKLLTKTTGVSWKRVPQSGAFATTNGSEDSRFQGDVFTEDENFKDFVVECKSTADRITLEDLYNNKSLFWAWVDQARTEAKGKMWILLFKADFGHIFFVSEEQYELKIQISDFPIFLHACSFKFKGLLIGEVVVSP